MIFYESRLLADDSHEKTYLILFFLMGKISQNLSSAAVVIGPLRVSTDSTQEHPDMSQNLLTET